MSSVPARPRWHFLFSPKWLGWHAFTVLATAGMLWLGDWQFRRAESGNALSWAYTFEPPAEPGEAEDIGLPGAVAGAGPGARLGRQDRSGAEEQDDPELAAYNAYLARLNEQVKGHGRWHGLR